MQQLPKTSILHTNWPSNQQAMRKNSNSATIFWWLRTELIRVRPPAGQNVDTSSSHRVRRMQMQARQCQKLKIRLVVNQDRLCRVYAYVVRALVSFSRSAEGDVSCVSRAIRVGVTAGHGFLRWTWMWRRPTGRKSTGSPYLLPSSSLPPEEH